MNRDEAGQFIEQVLKLFWPRWIPSENETAEWVGRLLQFEYYPAKKALNDFVFESKTKSLEPPNGKIMHVLIGTKPKKEKKSNDPVLLYTLVRKSVMDDQKIKTKITMGTGFCSSNGKIPDRHNIETQAQHRKEQAERLYGHEVVIIFSEAYENAF